jgi:hypothetical protein
MIKALFITLLTYFFLSCSESKNDPPKTDYEIRMDKQKELDTLNLRQAFKLTNKNDADLSWDTASNFTYKLQETFENSGKPMSFIGRIKDITKKDSLYVLKIISDRGLFKSYNAEILVDNLLLQKLTANMNQKKSREGCFILYVSRITSSSPILSSDVEPNGDNVEDATSYITYDYDETLIKIYGRLTDYFIYDKLGKDEDED